MPIDIHEEKLLKLHEAAESLPSKPDPSTVWRWQRRGVRGVRLETICVGGIRYTSAEALQRFADRLTAEADGEPAPTPARVQAARKRRVAAAMSELEREGI